MSAPVPKLLEGTVTLIQSYIQANIGAALDAISSNGFNTDVDVTLENPASYFIYEKPQGYRLPAVFVMSDNFDFKTKENASNFINATAPINVSIEIEDKTQDLVTYKAWRYQSALYSVLNGTQILSGDSNLKLIVWVYKMLQSALYNPKDVEGESGSASFRKEVVLQCEVSHLENF